MRLSAPFFALASITMGAAHSQVIYASDQFADMDNFLLDVASGLSTGPVWTGAETWGAAADDLNNIMYINDGPRLHSWIYNDPNPASDLGFLVDFGATTTNGVFGLAYDDGVLYAVDTGPVDAIFTVDLVTRELILVYNFVNTAGNPGGLAADPTTGLLYYSQDSTSTVWVDSFGNTGPGAVEVDLVAQTERKIIDYPSNMADLNDVDGCSFDPSGRIYLIEDEPAPLHNFDLATLTYDPAPPMNAIADVNVFGGGAFSAELGSPGPIGSNYCMANVNSTGAAGSISATGTPDVGTNDVTLIASGLPSFGFGFFIVSQASGFAANPGGSDGNLCLSGAIGRYVGPGQVMNTGAAGEFSLGIDLTAIPRPSGPVSASAGETWFFQTWHRDVNAGGSSTSNFTDGLELTFS